MKNNSLAVTTIWFQDPGEVILKAVSVHLLNRERVVIFKGKTNLDSGKLSFPPVKPGKYRMEATAEGFEPLRCGLEITGKEEEELFFLGRKKIPFIFFGGKKVFLEKKPREVGVVFAEKKPTQKTLNRLLPSNKITSTEEFGYQEGFSKKVKLKSKTLRKEVCKYLRKSKKVAFSGLILDTPSGEAIPTGEVFLQLFPGVDREQFLKKVKKESKEFKWVKTISHGEEFIALQYTGEEENFLEKANLFGDREEVYLVDYGLYFGETMTGQVFPADPLRQGQYHLVVTGMPQAWQILQDNGLNFGGNPDLILAVPDGGIQTTGSGAGVPHPDFNTNIVGGNLTAQLTTPNPGRKLYSTVDYRTNAGAGLAIINNNDNVVGSHGTRCGGIASAFSEGAGGVIGVAPNVRLVGAIDPGFTATNNTRISEVYTHLTGFDPVWTPAQYAGGQRFPRNYKNPGLLSNFNSNASLVIPDGSPPDIASYSISNNTYSAAAIRNVFFQAARLGRKRRGTVQVGLAQNACQPFRNNGTWGPDSGFIVVSASGVDHIGRETKAGYSNYAIDLTPGIDVCAPSGTAMGGAVAPPLTVGVLTSTINTSGNTNDTVTTTRTLLANANPGAMSINASTAAVPASSSMALLQRANNPHVFEWVIVVPPAGGVTGNNYPLLHPVRNSYRAADGDRLVLFSGANLHWDLFMDGTSAATPQVAGLAALLLSVRPGMNWLDVRRVLRGTAVPIDIRHRGPLPQNITTANNYLDSGGNVIHATDFNWFEFNPASPRNMAAANPLLDVNGQLDPNGNPAIMSNGAPNYPANNNSFQQYFINMGPPPGGNFRFRKRQAILIGAESTLAAQVPDPGTGNTNFVMVANGNGFDAGNIIIGRDTQTILQITPLNPAGVPTPNIDVLSTDGFRVGDSIQIQLTGGTVIRTVTGFGGNGIFNNGITGSSTRITLNANITMAAGDNAVPVQLDPAAWERATILNRVGNRINLTAGLTNPFNPAGGTIVVRTANCEIRVVKDVQPDGIDERLEVDKFEHTHASAVRVTGGRIADYSFMYGYGRIDGPAAVTAALNYFAAPQVPAAAGTPPVPQEDQYPDIQIRNTLADTGTVATPLVHSPDIWLRKANDMLGNMPAIGAKGPHEQVLPEFRFEKYEGTAANNDLVLSGDYPGAAAATYVITNDGAGNFSCAKDGVHSIGPSAISANTFQPVMDGFSLMFGSSAYDGSEKWTIKAEPASRNFFVRVKNRGLLGTYVPNTMPAVFTATPDFYRVRFFIHLTNGSPVIRYQSAAGLDDLEVKGTYNQAAAGTFTIIIDGTPGGASPDTFSYQHNNGGTTSGEAITGDWQNIGNDVEIKFRSTRGHTLTNRWQLLARPNTANDRFHSLEDFIIGNPTQNPFNFQLDRAGTHLLTTVNFSQSIDNGAAGFNPSLAYNQTRIFHSTWAENLLPVRKSAFSPKPGSPLRMFLLAECVPHDGPLIGNTPANNNNLSYREVLFAHFQFKDATGAGEFRSFIEVDSIGTVSNETMTIDVVSDCVTFTTESVE
ncbi:MAG: S8 family serine peptidase [bacterium]|nr:S8 family serine peptidase [bacterium]